MTYVVPTMISSTTNCIWVISERNNYTKTLCPIGDTTNNSTVLLYASHLVCNVSKLESSENPVVKIILEMNIK
jgi:competence transcription factor ComK